MIGVLVSGEGTNLQALLDAGLPVVAVASNRAEAHALKRAAIADVAAAAFPLDEYADRAERDQAMADWLEDQGVRIVVCAGYMHLLTSGFLARFPDRIVNVHPSLLPELRGLHAVRRALEAGVRETGVTVHLMVEEVDAGPIVAQEAVPVLPEDTEETLLERLHPVEHRLLVEAVADYFWMRRGA